MSGAEGVEKPLTSEDVEAKRERKELEKRIESLEDLVERQAKRIDELEQEVDGGATSDHLPDAEKFAREDGYNGLSANRERAVRVWEEFVEHAERNAVGTVTYSLDYDRLRKAVAATCEGVDAKKEVDSKTADRIRDQSDEIAPVRVEKGDGGTKKVVVNGEVWACYRPDEVVRRLMPKKDVVEFTEGDS
jgi:uncharacterized protein with von Willebrand factor type A (vWA) domain